MRHLKMYVPFLLCMTVLITTTIEAANDYSDDNLVSPYCPDSNSNYTSNTTYHSNLNILLSYLSSNSSSRQSGYGYHHATVGSGNDTVYGAYLCRGDLTPEDCGACVSAAEKRVFKTCPVQKSSMIWLTDCYLRFSDRPFFSVLDSGSIMIWVCNPGNASDVSSFMDLLGKTLTAAAEEAASGGPQLKFGTKEGNISSFESVYTMTQCMPGLTQLDCQQCLTTAIGKVPSLCYGRQGGRVRLVSCNLRYEVYPFYSKVLTVSSPTPLSQPPAPKISTPKGKSGVSAGLIIAVVATVVFVLLVAFIAFLILCTRARKKKLNSVSVPVTDESDVQFSNVEFLQFDLDTIMAATNNFSDSSKLGEGGFGAVYKGKLPNGQDMAVKRLSRTSRQGAEEFKNEVVLVAKLQHRNLVRLLGFCLDGEEKMLIYEFVPNKSLDHFLFDNYRQQELSWPRRYNIIEGIARGMLYLHEDSQLKIIHRDLKASNILLDNDLNPKVADFGTARLFDADQTQGNTNRIIGTRGYMSPEYAMHGIFSVKADVYSFGVLILEIISGKKVTSFYDLGNGGDLLNYAWKLWRDGIPLELLDVALKDSYSRVEVIRCIHIGLSCVQEDPAKRPTMQTIVLMLNSHSVTIANPERPAGYIHSITQPSLPIMELEQSDKSTSQSVAASVNEASITDLYPR